MFRYHISCRKSRHSPTGYYGAVVHSHCAAKRQGETGHQPQREITDRDKMMSWKMFREKCIKSEGWEHLHPQYARYHNA